METELIRICHQHAETLAKLITVEKTSETSVRVRLDTHWIADMRPGDRQSIRDDLVRDLREFSHPVRGTRENVAVCEASIVATDVNPALLSDLAPDLAYRIMEWCDFFVVDQVRRICSRPV